jgi:salicylate hydroxylase
VVVNKSQSIIPATQRGSRIEQMGLRVAIVGGGIGGLSAAGFLRSHGVDATVYEQSSALREVGAGIMVPPNMARALTRLGLTEALQACAVCLETAWEMRRWQNGNILFSQEMGRACLERYGASTYSIHRCDLITILSSILPKGSIELDRRCIGARQDESEVELHFTDRSGREIRVTCDVVIGADGIHSVLREAIGERDEASFHGLCAYRCLVPEEKAEAFSTRHVQTIWLGPGRHLVHYPISRNALVNIVAVAPSGEWRQDSWSAEGRLEDLMREFEGWSPDLLRLLGEATQIKRHALCDRLPLKKWVSNRIALLGDAAHAMLPFLAQGAAQSIEDAAVLAACLGGAASGDIDGALSRYERIRGPRANEVQRASAKRQDRNHLADGEAQRTRDAMLAGGDLLTQNDWLYGYDLDADISAAGVIGNARHGRIAAYA